LIPFDISNLLVLTTLGDIARRPCESAYSPSLGLALAIFTSLIDVVGFKNLFGQTISLEVDYQAVMVGGKSNAFWLDGITGHDS